MLTRRQSLTRQASPAGGASYGGRPRVRSHCRVRKRGIEWVRGAGIKWTNGSTKRQCDRALGRPAARSPRPAGCRSAGTGSGATPPCTWGQEARSAGQKTQASRRAPRIRDVSLSKAARGSGPSRGQVTPPPPARFPPPGPGPAPRLAEHLEHHQRREEDLRLVFPGREPPVLAVKRPARPYRSPTQNRFTA
jgi:hypothetical protein